MDANAHDCLKPGCLSRDGFLGGDPRPIETIIAEDAVTLREMGIDPVYAAVVLESIFHRAEAAMESCVSLYDGKVKARLTEGLGIIPCPFGCGDAEPKGIVEIRLADGTELLVSPLGIHLLHTHGFLEGCGSPFRLEPIALQRLFHAIA